MFKTLIGESIYNEIVKNKSGSTLSHLLKQQPVQLLSKADSERYKAHPEDVLKHPSALYILDITPAEASDIQRQYGVMCLSGDNPDISPLIDVSDYFKPSPEKKKFRGWDRVLDSVEHLPSNALLLIDRYLFSSRSKSRGDGLDNVRHILSELLPKEFFGKDYHVTIVFNVEEKHRSYTFTEIASKLYDIARQLRPEYTIMVEVLGIRETCALYDDSHDRQIVSNYFFVEASHKLAAFDQDNKGTVSQSIIPWNLFTESSFTGDSSAPLESIDQTVACFRKFYAALSNEVEHDTYLYAVNGEMKNRCTGVRNRLLK